ncbi:MAG: coproporphyrinogen III oxidase [Bacillaceae bacterium]|nr:coproporphyrinogen III oxidase [Bacillaceae bacterium]
MRVQVICRGHQFYREIELLLSLFFEPLYVEFLDGDGNAVKTFGDPDTAGLEESLKAVLQFDMPPRLAASAELTGDTIETPITTSYDVESDADDQENRKRAKQVVSHVLLRVLEEATGLKQPWGILTGIRPAKLLHTMRENGVDPQEAREQLQQHYLVKPEKVELLERIIERQLHAIPDLYRLQDEVSLYIGIPFCPTKCAYCTFPAYAINGRAGSVEAFLEGLHYEIQHIGSWLKERGLGVTTIYFGGGTPTSIEAEQMDALFDELSRYIDLDRVRELTVEAGRPDTITPEKIEVMKKWKVDRISINPQSFTQETLKAIGRHHTVDETIEKYRMAREMGMQNINMDLIIGLPGEDRTHLAHSLRQLDDLMPESLTVHTLSFKRASTMTRNRDRYQVSGREEIDAMMKMASEWTEEKGYVPYYLYRQKNILGNLENVGYSLKGKESLYNIIIMEEKQTILGLGCGAVGKHIDPQTRKIKRWPNPKDPGHYIERYRDMTAKKLNDLDHLYKILSETS